MRKNIFSKVMTVVFCLSTVLGSLTVSPTTAFAQSATLKEPFMVRNSFYNKTGIEWETASEEQRKAFLKERQQQEKARRQKERAYQKELRAREKARQNVKKTEEQKKRARIKAEQARKRAEKRNQTQAKQRAKSHRLR